MVNNYRKKKLGFCKLKTQEIIKESATFQNGTVLIYPVKENPSVSIKAK